MTSYFTDNTVENNISPHYEIETGSVVTQGNNYATDTKTYVNF